MISDADRKMSEEIGTMLSAGHLLARTKSGRVAAVLRSLVGYVDRIEPELVFVVVGSVAKGLARQGATDVGIEIGFGFDPTGTVARRGMVGLGDMAGPVLWTIDTLHAGGSMSEAVWRVVARFSVRPYPPGERLVVECAWPQVDLPGARVVLDVPARDEVERRISAVIAA